MGEKAPNIRVIYPAFAPFFPNYYEIQILRGNFAHTFNESGALTYSLQRIPN